MRPMELNSNNQYSESKKVNRDGHYDLDGAANPFELPSNTETKSQTLIAAVLSSYLADTYTLYLKTQKFHWNVTGPSFRLLHQMFEEQYKELAESIDLIAERIRALGHSAPGSFSEFQKLASIKEDPELLTAENMIKQLLTGHEYLVRVAKSQYSMIDANKDPATLDMLTRQIYAHEKTAWMLKSFLN